MAEQELTFDKAVENAAATEMASKNLINIGRKTPSSDNNVNKAEEETKPPHFQPKTRVLSVQWKPLSLELQIQEQSVLQMSKERPKG